MIITINALITTLLQDKSIFLTFEIIIIIKIKPYIILLLLYSRKAETC